MTKWCTNKTQLFTANSIHQTAIGMVITSVETNLLYIYYGLSGSLNGQMPTVRCGTAVSYFLWVVAVNQLLIGTSFFEYKCAAERWHTYTTRWTRNPCVHLKTQSTKQPWREVNNTSEYIYIKLSSFFCVFFWRLFMAYRHSVREMLFVFWASIVRWAMLVWFNNSRKLYSEINDNAHEHQHASSRYIYLKNRCIYSGRWCIHLYWMYLLEYIYIKNFIHN